MVAAAACASNFGLSVRYYYIGSHPVTYDFVLVLSSFMHMFESATTISWGLWSVYSKGFLFFSNHFCTLLSFEIKFDSFAELKKKRSKKI